MQRRIPTYQFYGEYLSRFDDEPIHYEPLSERSAQHDWRIKPHQHTSLAQIFYIESAGANIHTMGMDFLTHGPTILFVPPMTVHGFKFSEHMRGSVISLRTEHLDQVLSKQLAQFADHTAMILSDKNAAYFKEIAQLFDHINATYFKLDHKRDDLLATQVLLILTYLNAETGPAISHQPSRSAQSGHELKALKFCQMVEQTFGEMLSVNDYGAALHLSAPQLTRIINRLLGATPSDYIADRRIAEAKRLLRFTRQSISDISERCGFRDVSYFSRAFKKKTNLSPSAYRKQNGT